jgi:hypothetical protein
VVCTYAVRSGVWFVHMQLGQVCDLYAVRSGVWFGCPPVAVLNSFAQRVCNVCNPSSERRRLVSLIMKDGLLKARYVKPLRPIDTNVTD